MDKNINANHTSQNEGGINNRKRALIIGESILKNGHNKRMKSTVALKSIPGTTKECIKRHDRGGLEDNSTYSYPSILNQ